MQINLEFVETGECLHISINGTPKTVELLTKEIRQLVFDNTGLTER